MLRKLLCCTGLLLFSLSQGAVGQEPQETYTQEELDAIVDSAADDGSYAVGEETDLYVLEFSYPGEAAATAEVADLLQADMERQREQLIEQAKDGKQASEEAGYSFNPYGLWIEWETVSDLPRWLSLSAHVSVYNGGAHPNHWFDALLWDYRAGERRDALDLFQSKEAFSAAIREAFCEVIDGQREEKRGEEIKRTGDNPFNECLDPADYWIVPGSSNGDGFDLITILVPPYEAGPYAEGSYQATVRVTPAVVGAAKPEYREFFSPTP